MQSKPSSDSVRYGAESWQPDVCCDAIRLSKADTIRCRMKIATNSRIMVLC
jgi:hypothetical protein